jgi:hypothetical protein
MSDSLDELHTRSAEEPFRGFRCWRPEDVGEIMSREAAVRLAPVLLATHQPPHITKVSIPTAGSYPSLGVISQDECLEAIMADRDPSLLAPIIGQPGTGKSHLVLWMKARLVQESAPNRKIIYLPKGETSLSRVIEILLDGRTGGGFDKIRESVANASRQMTVKEQADRLRDELAIAIGRGEGLGDDPYFITNRPYVDHLTCILPDLLHDPVYSQRLLGEGRVLRRIAEESRTGGREQPAEVLESDLEITLTQAQLGQLSKPGREALADLADTQLRAVAVELLNKILPRCLSRVYGVEPMQLVGVMRELRQRLFEENPKLELILMVEDFTLLQGIQYDLLEAMIEIQKGEGRAVICPMKTIMAVTGGFLQRMLQGNEGLRTRIMSGGHIYSLDVGYGDTRDDLHSDALNDFTARYMNAVRLGIDTIEAVDELPNACTHCDHRPTCHDAFGASDAEYGLYPFNGEALDRMVRSRQEAFNPRDLLGVMAETLTTRLSELDEGRFPSANWARQFDPRDHGRPPLPTLSLPIRGAIDETPKPEQRSVLLTFWGGVPDELCNLDDGIHEAFDIPLITAATTQVKRREPPDRDEVTPRPTERDQIAADLEAWIDGVRLPADRALVIRRWFLDAIWTHVDEEGSLYAPSLRQAMFREYTDVEIENSGGSGGATRRERFRVRFTATNDNALLFAAILTAQATGGWRFEGGPAALVSFLARVDAEAARLRAYIDERLTAEQPRRDAAVQLLAWTGLLAGVGGASDTSTLLSAAMSEPPEPGAALPDQWRSVVTIGRSHHRAIRDFILQASHISLSRAEPLAINGAATAPALQALAKTWAVPAPDPELPAPAQTLQAALASRLVPALDAAQTKLSEWWQAVGPTVGDPSTASRRAKRWLEALEHAKTVGFLSSAGRWQDLDPGQLQQTLKLLTTCLEQWSTRELGPQVAAAAKMPWARLEPTRTTLEVVTTTLTNSISKANNQVSSSAASDALEHFALGLDALGRAARITSNGVGDGT